MKSVCRCPRVRHQHGTRNMYQHCGPGCRCVECVEASHAYHRNRRVDFARWTDRTGTVRRLQALAASGWSLYALGDEMKVTHGAIWSLRDRPAGGNLIQTAVANWVAAEYDRLWPMEPAGRYQARTIRHAERQGWAEPWRWVGVAIDDPTAVPLPLDEVVIDEVVVDRIIDGRFLVPKFATATPELIEAVRRLAAAGCSDTEIGMRAGRSRAAAMKIRTRYGIPSGVRASGAAA